MKHAWRRSTWAHWVGGGLAAVILAGWFTPWAHQVRALPDTWQMTPGSGYTFYTGLPLTARVESGEVQVLSSGDEQLQDEVTLTARNPGTARITLSLLGLLPVKRVQVEIAPGKVLIPGGQAIGVALRTAGVMVVGSSDLGGEAGASPARLSGVEPGDVITAVNGSPVTGAEQLTQLAAASGGAPLQLTVSRNDKEMRLTVTPKKDTASGLYRLGLWVRDSTAGVGTLSFYDPETGAYGALGHAITDVDTGKPLTVSQGQILKATVVDVKKGQKGAPGELKGSFLREQVKWGTLTKNTILGVYGQMDPIVNPLYPEGLPIGLQDTVRKGPAQILSCVSGEEIKAYNVEIIQVNRQTTPAPKSMVLQVTDPELLAITGGIVQGMSGSPIIQDGKIVGAVTHVLVNDPTRGYGIFIENMLDAIS